MQEEKSHAKSVSITSFLNYQKQLESFTCGNPKMDEFLRKEAETLNSNFESSTAGLFNEDDELVGFYSLSASVINIKNVYEAKKFSGLSKSKDYTADSEVTYPAIKLNFLAVDKKHQRKHYGSWMIRRIFAGLYVTKMIANIGFVALILDSTPEAVDFYERVGFEEFRDDSIGSTVQSLYPMFIKMERIMDIAKSIDLPDNLYEL